MLYKSFITQGRPYKAPDNLPPSYLGLAELTLNYAIIFEVSDKEVKKRLKTALCVDALAVK